MSQVEFHSTSSWFTSGPRFAMVNFVPARFHRRRFKHEIKLFVSNWKINCHFWKELIMLENRTRVILIIWKKGSPWCTKPNRLNFVLRRNETAFSGSWHLGKRSVCHLNLFACLATTFTNPRGRTSGLRRLLPPNSTS